MAQTFSLFVNSVHSKNKYKSLSLVTKYTIFQQGFMKIVWRVDRESIEHL